MKNIAAFQIQLRRGLCFWKCKKHDFVAVIQFRPPKIIFSKIFNFAHFLTNIRHSDHVNGILVVVSGGTISLGDTALIPRIQGTFYCHTELESLFFVHLFVKCKLTL